MNKLYNNFLKPNLVNLLAVFLISSLLISCGGYKKMEDRDRPLSGPDKARKNIEEGRGASIGSLMGRGGKTSYEFSTSNPMWRASLETLDFLPLTTVDYSGGIIITDWYSDNNSERNEAIKISLRFLANDIRSESLKIIILENILLNLKNVKKMTFPIC